MSEVILFTNPNTGDLSIMTIVSSSIYVTADKEELTEDDFFNHPDTNTRLATTEDIAKRDLSRIGVSEFHIVDSSIINQDTYFRKAWKYVDGALTTDMVVAKEVHRDFLRCSRQGILDQLDVQQLRALVSGDQTTVNSIEIRKQQLRDLPAMAEIDTAETPEQLKSVGLSTLEA